jgi:hypothetical protein
LEEQVWDDGDPGGRRLKELEKENTELKKMLADSLLKNRVLEIVNAKNGEPGAQETDGHARRRRRGVFRAGGVSVSRARPLHVALSGAAAVCAATTADRAHP